MKDKLFTFSELERSLNAQLRVLTGMKYTDGIKIVAERCQAIIQGELDARGIQELCFGSGGNKMDARMKEHGIEFWYDSVASIHFELKRDQRVKYGGGKGSVIEIRVAFDSELLPLTLHAGRSLLLKKSREKMTQRINKLREEAMRTVQEMDAELEKLERLFS